MSDTTAAGPRAVLTAERERLSSELEAMGLDRSSFDEGFADSGQVTAERGEVEALVGTLRETLLDINDALEKFDAGTYGTCEECGNRIAAARLEAMPMARLCITCASKRR
jgi:RNA polymerase-binding transcription factor DksA